jgi:hypothetical protein
MTRVVQARLDKETTKTLEQIRKRSGWSNSEIVRRGILLLASVTPPSGRRKISGLGKYDFGVTDLATNKKYMEGFGKS